MYPSTTLERALVMAGPALPSVSWTLGVVVSMTWVIRGPTRSSRSWMIGVTVAKPPETPVAAFLTLS